MRQESGTLLDELLAAARAERERVAAGKNLISREDCPSELNAMGHMRWYMHSRFEDPSNRSLYFHELTIPTGSRSGLMVCQGGIVNFVLEGEGYTELDGVRHEWEAGDVIGLPVKEQGVTYRHVNTGADDVVMLVAWPNLDSALGPEGGVAMEVREPCPEYGAAEAG